MIVARPFKTEEERKDFNSWVENLKKSHSKIKKKLGSTSHIDSRNEFNN